jgi:hypothetical protein
MSAVPIPTPDPEPPLGGHAAFAEAVIVVALSPVVKTVKLNGNVPV